ncbi:MAG: DEAD/DEAH box helicase [Phototrophicaceae bacterium]
MTDTFRDLGLSPELLETLDELGYVEPTPIQSQTIPQLLVGRDVFGQSQTGTGKTAAYTLPLIQQLHEDGLQMLVLAPTRELAIQVSEAIFRYGSQLGISVLPVYGQQSYTRQIRRLERGVHVVVGTPGRTLDLIQRGAMDLRNIRFLVLDEADEMLQLGFIEDIETILRATPSDRQSVLFSATLSSSVERLARTYMRDPLIIRVQSESLTVSSTRQRYYVVNDRDKVPALCRLLEVEDLKHTMVFTQTRAGSAELAETLSERGYRAVAIHGDLAQNERERILKRFKEGYFKILVATDVMARGVDIEQVSHVINFDIPMPTEYVHRIGRTGRAGRDGDAITLVTPRDKRRVQMIEQYTGERIRHERMPSIEAVLEKRDELFKERITERIATIEPEADLLFNELLEMQYDANIVAVAALSLMRENAKLPPLEEIEDVSLSDRSRRNTTGNNRQDRRGGEREPRFHHENNGGERRGYGENRGNGGGGGRRVRGERTQNNTEEGMVRLHMNIGRAAGVGPGDIVYSVASAANISGKLIGHIDIRQNETFLDIPEDHVDEVLRAMKRNGKVRGKSMSMVRA